MKFRVKFDFAKARVAWTSDRQMLFGPENSGFIIEGETPEKAINEWNGKQLQGMRLNPFYLEIIAI